MASFVSICSLIPKSSEATTHMIRTLSVTILLLTTQVLLRAQTADILVSQGRSFLAARDLTNANARFASALAAAPNHSTANVFRAATRLLTLADQPAGKAFLDRLLIGPTNRSVYGWTADFARTTNGTILAPTNVSAAFLTAFLRTNMLT